MIPLPLQSKSIELQKGMTLIEMVIAIAVAGIAIAGLAAAFSSIVTRTADPMIQTQAQIAAESLMEEILLKPFPASSSPCPAAPANRQDFDDVCDYNGYATSGVADQTGTAVTGLESYDVSVTVVNSALGSVMASESLLVTVTVTSPLGASVVFNAYRTDY